MQRQHSCFRFGDVSGKSLRRKRTINDFGPQPGSFQSFRGFKGGTPTPKWIEHDIALIGSELNASARYQRLEFIDSPSCLELSVTRRRGIFPNIGQIEAERIEKLTVPAVVLDITPTVAADGYGLADIVAVERRGLTLGEIEQRVVRGVELLSAWKCAFHGDGNPMSEKHSFGFKVCRQVVGPLRQIVDEDGSTGLHDPDALVDPCVAPVQVILASQVVGLAASSVIFAEIEWRVCEDRLDGFIADGFQQVQAVSVIQRPAARGERGRNHF